MPSQSSGVHAFGWALLVRLAHKEIVLLLFFVVRSTKFNKNQTPFARTQFLSHPFKISLLGMLLA